MRDIGKNIKTLRTKKNMTQDELAEKLFVTRQTVSNYETGRSRPDVDMLAKIAEVLETDANTVLYGASPAPDKSSVIALAAGCCLTVLLLLLREIAYPYAQQHMMRNFSNYPVIWILSVLDPLIWLTTGWSLMRMLMMAIKKAPHRVRYVPYLRRGLAVILMLWLVMLIPYMAVYSLDDYLYSEKIRGEIVDMPYESNGELVMGQRWQRIPLPMLSWLEPIGVPVSQFCIRHSRLFLLPGILLCLCGFPIIPSKNE